MTVTFSGAKDIISCICNKFMAVVHESECNVHGRVQFTIPLKGLIFSFVRYVGEPYTNENVSDDVLCW